jgi:hypothetical protein
LNIILIYFALYTIIPYLKDARGDETECSYLYDLIIQLCQGPVFPETETELDQQLLYLLGRAPHAPVDLLKEQLQYHKDVAKVEELLEKLELTVPKQKTGTPVVSAI